MKKYLVEIIGNALKDLGLQDVPTIEIEVPRQDSMGDLATPMAMSLAAKLKKPPRKIAEEIVDSIRDKKQFEKIEIAGPGFINFTFSRAYLYGETEKILEQKSTFLREDIGKGKKVQLEFISANPTGPLHLGHGRGGATGEALSNLLKAAGFQVEREYYINDAGKQVRLLGLSVFARYHQLLKKEYSFPEDGYKGAYVEEIVGSIIQEKGDAYAGSTFDEVSEQFINYSYKKILNGIENDLKDFGITFDVWQSEHELFEQGDVDKAIGDLKQKGVIYDKDGALWFRSTDFGDDKDRVIVKQDGEYTYFASDIAYHRKKIEKRYDELIDIWGADHHGYIQRVHAGIEALGYPKEKLRVLLVQMVTLLRGGQPVQMSKRAGEFITLREVMEEVGVDTTKFIFLTRRPDSHLEFDLDVAKAQSSENPVFYVQYAHARINSIFVNAREKALNTDNLFDTDLNPLSTHEELRIIRKLLMYPMVFEGAVHTYEPHRITFYLQELSGMFHPFYNKHRVMSDDLALTRARLALCEAIKTVLHDGLEILGVSAPDKM